MYQRQCGAVGVDSSTRRGGVQVYRPKVLSLEGLSPLLAAGHWLPEMKALAGGRDELHEPGAAATRLRWEQVLAYAPDVLLLPLSVNTQAEAALAEVAALASQPGWWALPAVQRAQVRFKERVHPTPSTPRRAKSETGECAAES